jgi:flagellar M-ring protein FliF
VQGLVGFLKSLGAARLAAMVAVTVALIGFFAFLIMRVTAPQMTPLFTDLSFEDSAAIVKDLERQAIAYELKNDNSVILVPKDRVARLRMKLAESGLPKGGSVGYEIFDQLRPEHQPLARAGGRARPHHPGARPGAGRSCPLGFA